MTTFSSLGRSLAALLLLAAPLAAQAQNVGIGTTAPTQTLDVNGSLRVRGLSGSDTRLPVVQPDGTLGLTAPYGTIATPSTANPAFPTAATGSVATGTLPTGVAVSGTMAYVTNGGDNTLQVFDVSNPAAPVLRGSVATAGGPTAVAVSGTMVYVVTRDSQTGNTLQVFDASAPAAPVLRGSLVVTGSPVSVAVNGTTVCVLCSGVDHLRVFDVSNPAAPVLQSTKYTGLGARCMAMSGTMVFVGLYTGAINVYDVSVPTAPPVLSHGISTPGRSIGIAANGTAVFMTPLTPDYMYIYERVGGGRGISPTGFVGSGGTEPTSVAVNSTTAYVVNHSSNNLAAFDITTPSAPVLLGTVGTDVDPYRVAVSGTTVYVVNQGSNTLQTFSFLAGPSRVVTVNPDGSLASLPLNFVQTQSATTQTGSFNLSGNGYLGGRVGIGTTGPVEKLEVVGNIKISGGGNGLTFADGTTQTTASTTASSTTNLTGDISSTGPATTYNNVVPAAKGGAGTVSGLLKADGAGLVSAAVAGTDYAAPTGSAAYIQNTTALQAASAFNVSGAGTVGGLLSAGSATVSGSVGLGTTAPSQKLDVRGNLRLGDDGNGVGTGQAIEWVGPGVSSDPVGIYRVNPAADQSELRVVVGDVADANDKFVVGRMGGTSSEGGIPTGTFTPTFSVRSDGNVGVGTGTPTSTLQVAGSVAASIRTLNSGTLAATDYTVIVIGNVSLPAPDATNTGRLYHLINGTANTYSVTGTFRDAGSGGTLGSFTLGTTSGTRGITVQSDGTQWWILTRE